MAQFLAIAKVILSLLPAIIEAVKAIEAALPQTGSGAQKLELVRGVLQTAYSTGTDMTTKFDDIWPALSGAVSSVVTFFNNAGIFRKA